MRVGIISDIHDNVWNLAQALEGVKNADAMIVCGDLCSPFIVAQIAEGFKGPIHMVFGNNDGDLYRITKVASKFDNVSLHGELYEGELGGKRIAANHYNNISQPISASNQYDVVCYGHNHVYKIEKQGKTWLINPGTIMGYNPVQKVEVPATLAIYDAEADEATGYHIVKGVEGATGKLAPYEA